MLIDGDPIVYACGFAAQSKDAQGNVVAEPLSHAITNVCNLLHQISRDVTRMMRCAGEPGVIFTSLFLTGKGNYRENIATIKPYKGNRDKLHKPVHYDALRTFMRERMSAELVEGREADDAMASRQYQSEYESTVICTIDKDLLMVPGLHYNYKNKTLSSVSPLEGARAFWRSVLVGDAVDNIGGCYKIGPKKADSIMSCLTSKDLEQYNKEAYAAVLDVYLGSMVKYGWDIYGGLSAELALLENARLLWMQEFPGQLWVPPGRKPQWLPGYGE
jgi:hypothetical protein